MSPSPCSSGGLGPSPRVLCADCRRCLGKEQHARAGRAVRPLHSYEQARAGIYFSYILVVPNALLILSKPSVVFPCFDGVKDCFLRLRDICIAIGLLHPIQTIWGLWRQLLAKYSDLKAWDGHFSNPVGIPLRISLFHARSDRREGCCKARKRL